MPKTVLIIEDDPDIAECLRVGLESAHLKARVALTGDEGLAASLDKDNPPAAILLDLLLPGMSGLEICRRLRNEVTTKQTPVIIVTARSMETDLAASIAVGADGYITKPFSIREVVERVHCLLQREEKS